MRQSREQRTAKLKTALEIAGQAIDEWEARSPNWEDAPHVCVEIAAARLALERCRVQAR